MKLFGLLHNIVEGMGQGQVAPAAPEPRIPRPARMDDFSRHRMLGRVAKIIIETWDTGPFPTDLCWLLADAEDRILFVMPGGTLDKGVLGRIRNAPGIDKTAIRLAMRSTRHARFTVWQRDLIAEKASTRP
jgi:hypothetical protein